MINKDLVVPVKPFEQAIEWICKQDGVIDSLGSHPFLVIGSGLAALEISFALRKRWPNRPLLLKILPKKLSEKMTNSLLSSGIEVIENDDLLDAPALLCTGNDSPRWIKNSGLSLDSEGRVRTKATLQSMRYPNIFAAGDCAVIDKDPRPASGVWAVRAAKPLAENVERLVSGLDLLPWSPQRSALQLLSGPFTPNLSLGWGFWKGSRIGPSSLLWRLKKKIDLNFINMFEQVSSMPGEEMITNVNYLCRGCAAKIPSDSLQLALEKADLRQLGSQPEDAPVVYSSLESGTLVQSVDGFPALISDPWLNARLTTLHACSDIWASGASVVSAQPLITLPVTSSKMQEELLIQILGGIKSALDLQGARLIGGHTLESRNAPNTNKLISLEIQIGLSVNGIVACNQHRWRKDGLQSGDVLLLSRALGSGVIFSAAMKGNVNSKNLDSVLEEMNTSQHFLLEDLLGNQSTKLVLNNLHACTDITGFGLLGHLSEMLLSSNLDRFGRGLSPLNIKLDAERIPFYKGVLDLLEAGYSSTFAPANRKFWDLFEARNESPPLFAWASCKSPLGKDRHQKIMELIIDPQTCGPIALACSKELGQELINKGPWVQIGSVELI